MPNNTLLQHETKEKEMKKILMAFSLVLSMVIMLSPSCPYAAGTGAPTTREAMSATTAAQPQSGGIWKVVIRNRANAFGYPPQIIGSDRDYAPPFFDRLFSVGDDGKYKPGLALSWDVSKDGKTITFKLRQGVKFHDGTPFNAQAVKANLDNLIPPKATILGGISSVEAVDDYTVKLNLPSYNNLIFFHFAANPVTWMYSPEALKKNGEDWAKTHPVGTGPFMLKDHQKDISLTLVKNPDYWQKDLPYLDGIQIAQVQDTMTQALILKSGQADTIYDAQGAAVQLKDQGYGIQMARAGSYNMMTFDSKNSEALSKPKVRQAIEYAIDKEAICSGPGEGLFTPVYQVVTDTSPDYNKACPPRKYDPVMAKKLLREAGYPNGFSLKISVKNDTWKEGLVAIQSYLAQVGIKLDINYIAPAAYNLIRVDGKIENGTAAHAAYACSSNTLFMFDTYWRSSSVYYRYIVKPASIDKLIDQAKLSRDAAAITKINQQIGKLIYDDATAVPMWQQSRIAVLDKSVQNTGWFIYNDPDNNQFGTRTWLKK
jgi:peptide/nickel transport system substrate-binding protein